MDENAIVDLTSSFNLVNHYFLADEIICLDSDESFDLSVETKHAKSQAKKLHKINKKPSKATKSSKNQEQIGINFGDCPICWEKLGKNQLASTKCGHVYCLKCLERCLSVEKKCPTCRCSLKGNLAYHPLYLSTD